MKYIVFVNGIVWDSIVAKDKKTGMVKARRKFYNEFKGCNIPVREFELEDVKTFLGK